MEQEKARVQEQMELDAENEGIESAVGTVLIFILCLHTFTWCLLCDRADPV